MEEGEEDEIDPDEMSYEDLVALGEVVGEEKRGLTAEEISAAGCLRKRKFAELAGDVEMCVICQAEYEETEEEVVEIIGCGHVYHKECVTNWLFIRRSCPICGYEVDPPSAAAAGCKECGNSGDGNGGNIAGG
ncbi:E3 ubiquitin ligase BIG BROTHER-related [Linum grandiflorum]